MINYRKWSTWNNTNPFSLAPMTVAHLQPEACKCLTAKKKYWIPDENKLALHSPVPGLALFCWGYISTANVKRLFRGEFGGALPCNVQKSLLARQLYSHQYSTQNSILCHYIIGLFVSLLQFWLGDLPVWWVEFAVLFPVMFLSFLSSPDPVPSTGIITPPSLVSPGPR